MHNSKSRLQIFWPDNANGLAYAEISLQSGFGAVRKSRHSQSRSMLPLQRGLDPIGHLKRDAFDAATIIWAPCDEFGFCAPRSFYPGTLAKLRGF
jgi:hypothetical protein